MKTAFVPIYTEEEEVFIEDVIPIIIDNMNKKDQEKAMLAKLISTLDLVKQ